MADPTINLRQIETPKGLPQPGGNRLYAKDDKELYLLDDDGTEHQVGGGGSGVVETIVAGTNITVDNTDPANPIVSASGGTETLPVTIIDAKGDLIVGTAADTAARLAVGSDGNTLAADSTATPGVKYVTSSVPAILLAAGSTAASVPAGTPVGTIVFIKA